MQKYFFWLFITLLSLSFLSWCSKYDNEKLEETVDDFSRTAEQCLLDTRDSCIKYEDSRFCQALGQKAEEYLNVGGWYDDTPLEYEIIRERWRTSAWMAKAISKSSCEILNVR